MAADSASHFAHGAARRGRVAGSVAARARQLRERMAAKERALASLASAKQEARYPPEEEATYGAEHEAPAAADANPWHGHGPLQDRVSQLTEAPATPSVEDYVEDLTTTTRPPQTAFAIQDRVWLHSKDQMQSGCTRDACEIEIQGEMQRVTPAGTAGLRRRQNGATVAARAASARAAERVAAAKAKAQQRPPLSPPPSPPTQPPSEARSPEAVYHLAILCYGLPAHALSAWALSATAHHDLLPTIGREALLRLY